MLLDPKPALRVVAAVPGIPRDADGPVFREPWEAQAFAMALVLHERGLFTWSEWAVPRSGDEIKARRLPVTQIPARPITSTGSRRWNNWWRTKA